jgi:hypothetical protein
MLVLLRHALDPCNIGLPLVVPHFNPDQEWVAADVCLSDDIDLSEFAGNRVRELTRLLDRPTWPEPVNLDYKPLEQIRTLSRLLK